MNGEEKRKYEKLDEDVALFMKNVNSDPSLQNVTAPPEMRERVFEAIREAEAEKARESLCDEDKELLRLGRVYKRKRKSRKYFVLAAVLVMVLAFGITSSGGSEMLFEKITWMMGGRKQTNIDSDSENVRPTTDVSEEEAYAKIEETFGFRPVKLDYRPEGVEFQEVSMGDEIQGIHIVYGEKDAARIIYWLCPKYRDGSQGKDVEDELLDEYEIELSRTIVKVEKYLIEDDTVRWRVMFEYQGVSYSMILFDISEQEVEVIIQNLYFSE